MTGKERKQTSLTKHKLTEQIFRAVSEKRSVEHIIDLDTENEAQTPTSSKRQRKSYQPSRLPSPVVTPPLNMVNRPLNPPNIVNRPLNIEPERNVRYCINLSCKATVSQEDAFCKRCSCCICHKYDENKDPSLWLVCSSVVPSEGDSCGLTCHVECALSHERAGILKNGHSKSLDGSYYCIHCGKVNDLLRCWRKQLSIAKDARRVDILCYRLSLSHKLLSSSEKYHGLHDIVNAAMKKLESEVGPLDGSASMMRGIVNRLSVGAEVQRLCAHAVESLDRMLSSGIQADAQIHQADSTTTSFIKLEDISTTSATVVLGSEDYTSLPPDIVGFTLWHRNADMVDYPTEPTQNFHKATLKILISDLTPGATYMIKVVAFDKLRELAIWEVELKTKSTSEDVRSTRGYETSTKLLCGSHKTNSSCLSNTSSEGEESNNTGALRDLDRPETTVSEKSCQHTCKESTIGLQKVTPGTSGSALDEERNSTVQTESHRDSTNSMDHNQVSDVPKSDNESNTPVATESVIVPISESEKPGTACRLETGKGSSGRKDKPGSSLLENVLPLPEEPGSSSKKKSTAKHGEQSVKDGSLEGTYESCIKAVRQLECKGHIETSFRMKFLTWFSLRATLQEKRVVSAFVETLADEPASLAEQLVDTFSEAISSKRPPPVPTGFCMSLWH